MKLRILFTLIFIFAGNVVSQDTISSSDAMNFTNKIKHVKGKVAKVNVTKDSTVFINFDYPFPNETFTAVIFKSHIGSVSYSNIIEGCIIIVRGKIKKRKGTPNIIITEQSQIVKVECEQK